VKRLEFILLGTFAFAILGGCASTPSGEAFSHLVEPRANLALLYLYRPDENYGKALAFSVEVDGKEKGNIGNGAYMIIPLDAGKRVIQIHGLGYKDVPREVDAVEGPLTFLRVATDAQSKATSDLASLKREPERYIDKDL
jgi:hypothetical protein